MRPHLAFIHRDTPEMTVVEPRGLAVRSVDYYRAVEGADAEARVNRTVHDPVGRVIAQSDPRLFLNATAPANLVTIHGLSGTALCTLSVDAGLHVSLFGEAGQPVHSWDGRGSQHWMHYDNQLRLTALFEQAAEGEAFCAERLNYAANDQAFADHNQCGRLICHEDPAGAVLFNDYGLSGAILEQERCFAKESSPGFATHSRFNPLNDLLSRTDAQGNEQRFSQTVGGHLCAVDLRLNNTLEWLPMVSAITYNAHGQVEREVAGNGVITTLEYATEDGRLKRLLSRLGQDDPLQDLRYTYDPVGNVRSIEDAALPIRYFANQRIEPVSHYFYDTLYRLIEATGWEAGWVKHGPSSAMTADPAMPGNYRQTYRYDAGNNLLELTHVGPQNHGHRLVADAHSNRCLPVRDGVEPTEEDFRSGFDANGNLQQLQPGQTLSWDVRDQLHEVRPVERDNAKNDREHYVYGADGMRVRKVRSLQTNAQTVVIETRYLPGLEIRTHSGTGEVLHVIDVATGRGSVRVLHWEAGKPNEIINNQQRYSLTDHLGSSALELDQDAKIITQERYYPFGGTAWSNGEAVQVSYKTVRYSGKEQDATGLYYYGFRYYVPGLQRWLNPDPAGMQDGPNVFAFVNGNPVSYKDVQGLGLIDVSNVTPWQANLIGLNGPQVIPAEQMHIKSISMQHTDAHPVVRTHHVEERVMDNLILADTANKVSKVLLYLGSDNQALEAWRTRGQSHNRMHMIRAEDLPVPQIVYHGAGNCAEFAKVNFQLLASASSRRDPIYRVAAEGVDHNFVVIGDSRVGEVVYADAWPIFPLAHTGAHKNFAIGKVLEVIGPDPVPLDNSIEDWFLERNAEIKFPLKSGNKELDARIVRQIKQSVLERKMFNVWFSGSDRSNLHNYRSPSRTKISSLSAAYVEERLGHAAELQKIWRK